MASFFKTFGLGLLYIILLPFILLYWLLYAVFCVFMLIYQGFKTIILFCTGRPIFKEYEEDKLAKQLIEESQSPSNTTIGGDTTNYNTTNSNNTTTTYHQTNNYYQTQQNAFINGEDINNIPRFGKTNDLPNNQGYIEEKNRQSISYKGDNDLKRPKILDDELEGYDNVDLDEGHGNDDW